MSTAFFPQCRADSMPSRNGARERLNLLKSASNLRVKVKIKYRLDLKTYQPPYHATIDFTNGRLHGPDWPRGAGRLAGCRSTTHCREQGDSRIVPPEVFFLRSAGSRG
jgi:hypothetical protein